GTVSPGGLAPAPVGPSSTTPRRIESVTATAIAATATAAITNRSGLSSPLSADIPTTAGAISTATRLITLISGVIAGPAVSLNGSPTVSPVVAASCAGEPFPPWGPAAAIVLALARL